MEFTCEDCKNVQTGKYVSFYCPKKGGWKIVCLNCYKAESSKYGVSRGQVRVVQGKAGSVHASIQKESSVQM